MSASKIITKMFENSLFSNFTSAYLIADSRSPSFGSALRKVFFDLNLKNILSHAYLFRANRPVRRYEKTVVS